MKQIFLILSIVPFLFGCVQTREQRGAEIAKSEMMKRLYDADSYEPIETHIDSAYTSIYTDLAVIRAAHDLIELNAEEKKERLQRQYNSAKSSAAIWSDSRGWAIREDGAAMPEKNIGRPKKKWMITLINSKNWTRRSRLK